MNEKKWDLWTYYALLVILAVYAFYVSQTCSELGCVVIVIPIIGIMILSALEFIIGMIITLATKKKPTAFRITGLVISGIITITSIILLAFS